MSRKKNNDSATSHDSVGTTKTATGGHHQKSLLAAQALQNAIIHSATFSSIATDAKGVIQLFNVGAERMLGYQAADVIGKMTPADASDPIEVIARGKALSIEFATPIAPGFESLVYKASRGIEDSYELTYIRKDGSRFPAVVSITALRDEQNVIIGYLLIGTDNTARKQAEEALLKAEALRRAIFNSANFSYIATDTQGVIQIFNVGAERLLGYTAAEVVNKITAADIFDPEEIIARAMALSVENGTPVETGFNVLAYRASRGTEDTYDLTCVRKNGSRFVATVSVTALREDQGAVIGFLLVTTDSTARKQAEAELIKANALQSAIFHSANFSSIATDAKGVIQIFNVGAERMLGYTADEVVNKITPAEISDPQEIIARAKALSIELATPIEPGFDALVFKASRGIEDIYELTYIRKDGSRFPAVVSVTALRDAQDAIIGYLLIGTDNTARKQIEEERMKLDQRLRDQQFYTRSLIESNIDALMTTDPQGIITDVNKQMEALTGCTRDELIGAPFKNYFTDPQRAEAAIKQVLAEGKVTNYELTARSRDGKETVVSYNASTFYDRDRKLQGVFAAARDVTERKRLDHALEQAKEAAEASNRDKSVFLATMSHEIRTPMNGVIGMLELLSLTQLDAPQLAMLNAVRVSGKSLQRVIDDILDFSKIEAGKLEVWPEAASITSVFEAVNNIYAGTADSKGLLLQYSVDPAISPALMVDPLRLRQILNNLVSNALKFTTEGRIDIKAELIGRVEAVDHVRFLVQDTGIGISLQDQALLFQPFVQVASEAAHSIGGTGLGLTICRRLAQMMGGAIEMASEPGKGTTMIVELPLPIADSQAIVKGDSLSTEKWLNVATKMRRMAPDIAQAESEGTLVLLVDDHPTNRSLLLRQVNILGYAAESAENGVEALAQWKASRFGIVIADINMPKMNGYELTRSIREIEVANDGKRTPIIACTANALRGEEETCLAAGMDDYLAKPVELKNLAKILDRWLPITQLAAPVDRAVLAAITGGDAATEREILSEFQRINNEDAAMFELAVDKHDMPQITHMSHRIKGASRMVGATALADVCERIERAGRGKDWENVETNMAAFHHELESLNSYCGEAK